MSEPMLKTAILSDCGDFRYDLTRTWGPTNSWRLPVCMLNPSTADDERDDPAVLALIHFARRWGFGGLLIVNLYAFRSASPAAMRAFEGAVGPANGRYLASAIDYAARTSGKLLAAWGNDGARPHPCYDPRDEWFASRANHAGVDLICLGRTREGHPKHPMARGKHRIPRDQEPIEWRPSFRKAVAQ